MDCKVKEDSIILRKFFQISQDEFAKELEVDKRTIIRTENGITYPKTELIEKIYSYAFDKGLRLNLQKEMFFKDDLKIDHILLVYASKNGIEGEISINKGRLNNDFGKGFYCGDSYDKSVSFVCKYIESSVYFLEFNPKGLKFKKFEVDTNWMLAIAYFRGTLKKYKDSEIIKKIIEPILEVDYVIAPIADNRMFQIIDTFISGEITDEQCKHCLAATNLGYQYVFLKEKAIKNLKILENCYISKSEKDFYKKEQLKFQELGNDKSKLARIQYRGKGKYIDEILL